MVKNRMLRTLLVTGTLALAPTVTHAQSVAQPGQSDERQGSKSDANSMHGRPPHTPAFGVWRYLGKGRFGVTIWDLFYDAATAQPIRYNKLRLELTLDDDGNEASARAIVETINLQGFVTASRSGSASFVRIAFEPIE